MTEPEPMIVTGGWCAPHESLYDFPDITVDRDFKYPTEPQAAKSAPTRRQRFRSWRRATTRRFKVSAFAARKAWSDPDGYWQSDDEPWY